jgi:hypothetical protein
VHFLLIVAMAGLVARLERGRWERLHAGAARALAWRFTPVVVGFISAAIIAWIWGGVQSPPIFHDELSYIFQARLFASGRWFAPSPPMPDMFAQPHLLVVPVMASKYPPGHALLLSLGELVGMPALVVLALVALRAAVTFALARRLTNGGIALLTCALLLQGDSLRWSASYFSETTTGALLVVCWYALLRWHDEGSARWIALAALSLGWCAITRPYSALFFAIPIGVVVLRDVWRTGRWRHLALAMAVGSAIVGVLPLWSARTTGDWTLWPATLYTRDYMPYDHPHFGADPALPRRERPLDLALLETSLREVERQHTVANLPGIAVDRLWHFFRATWDAPQFALILAIIGILAAPRALWVGVWTVGTLFVGYLAHVTWADWTIYYMEVAPVLVFLTACGIAQLCVAVVRTAPERMSWRSVPRPTLALVAGSILLLSIVKEHGELLRETREANETYMGRLGKTIARLPSPSILFVRYSPKHSGHLSLITNGPDWPQAPVWVVADRGDARNAELLRGVPNRQGLILEELKSTVKLYSPQRAR